MAVGGIEGSAFFFFCGGGRLMVTSGSTTSIVRMGSLGGWLGVLTLFKKSIMSVGFAISDRVLHAGGISEDNGEQRNSNSAGFLGFTLWSVISQDGISESSQISMWSGEEGWVS